MTRKPEVAGSSPQDESPLVAEGSTSIGADSPPTGGGVASAGSSSTGSSLTDNGPSLTKMDQPATSETGQTPVLLEVKDLNVRIGYIHAVTGVSFTIREGEFFGVVGESGSGKSMTARSIIGLLPAGAVQEGEVLLRGEDMAKVSPSRMRQLRGGSIGFVFQDPFSALDPIYTVGNQLIEVQRARTSIKKAQAKERALELLDEVGISDPARVFDSYPHQLSGGMSQRVVIAMALISDPRLIIADEPTTALDVTIQLQVLDLLQRVAKDRKAAVMLITHDLAVVAETCVRVAVFYGGVIVEEATTEELFASPKHHYTKSLLESLPKLGERKPFRAIPGTPIRVLGDLTYCTFHPRCDHATALCRTELPAETIERGHRYRCIHPIGGPR